jgi:hypothetical protein
MARKEESQSQWMEKKGENPHMILRRSLLAKINNKEGNKIDYVAS